MTASEGHERHHDYRSLPFRRPGIVTLLLTVLAMGAGCHKAGSVPAHDDGASASPPEASHDSPWFIDITEDAGLRFVHDPGPLGQYFLPGIIGSGAALFDFDNDGRLDVYLVQNGGPQSHSTNRLYRQGADGRFTDVSQGSGLDIAGHGMGVAVGDVNNDGWPDVLVTEYGRVRLFVNNGNGTFTDVTKGAGLDSVLWGTSACFVDYDRDGWLDLVIVNYVMYDPARWCADPDGRREYCGPSAFNGTVTKLYHNLGPKKGLAPHPPIRFDDVTLEAGLGRQPGPGLGVFCADFNGDHWPDIFVANDGKPNHLWINQRDGTFKEEAVERGLAYNCLGRAEANMGVAIGDVNDDGLFDLFVTHLTDEANTLWTQGPRGMFQDRTAATGLAHPRWRGTGFGTALVDFDHDGALDLAVVNGRVKRGKPVNATAESRARLGSHWIAYAERNQLFANDGNGRFRDLSLQNAPFCAAARVCRGLACGDVDNDGAMDLLVTAVAEPVRLYRNVAPKQGHWLLVRAIDPALRRDAYGAEITVHATGRRWMRWINPGYSYLCSNDPRAHFGLGPAERVDNLEVVWPDGSEETFPGRPADRLVVLCKGQGTARIRQPDQPGSEKSAKTN